MAIGNNMADVFKTQLLAGNHHPANTYKMALYTSAASLSNANNAYVAGNEVSDANYAAGGVALGSPTVGSTGATSWLTFNNAVWPNATFTAMGCMIYNSDLAQNNMVACFNFGGNVTGGGGNFTVVMPTANATLALLRLA